ncbi:hypothetical protein, partial [Massilia glaciei]|uniref:hypothetical protein n=1 Tax=Massilia glaciei TaxID=1524097 RepID=UPI0011B24268
MKSCTVGQTKALLSALNKPAFAPNNVDVTLEFGECRQIREGRMLAFAVFMPEMPYPDKPDVSDEELRDRPFRLTAGLFDMHRRSIVSSYIEPFPFSGWIETYQGKAYVIPVSYSRGKALAFAISHDNERGLNAANSHVSVSLTLLMQRGTALKPVLRDIPLSSRVALTEDGGVCCSSVLMDTTRTLLPTKQQTLGMPDLVLHAEREVQVDERRDPIPKEFANIPKTYAYILRFNGSKYRPTKN